MGFVGNYAPYGLSPQTDGMPVIQQKRIALAKAMLYLDDMSVEEVSVAVGFNNFSYFCRVFRQVEGMSPTEYREKMTQEKAG